MSKLITPPVTQKQIDTVKEVLADPIVNGLWLHFVGLGQCQGGSSDKQYRLRAQAFDAYAKARDEFLKASPLAIPHIQGTHKDALN